MSFGNQRWISMFTDMKHKGFKEDLTVAFELFLVFPYTAT